MLQRSMGFDRYTVCTATILNHKGYFHHPKTTLFFGPPALEECFVTNDEFCSFCHFAISRLLHYWVQNHVAISDWGLWSDNVAISVWFLSLSNIDLRSYYVCIYSLITHLFLLLISLYVCLWILQMSISNSMEKFWLAVLKPFNVHFKIWTPLLILYLL